MNQLREQEDLLAVQELREQEQAAQEKKEPPQNSDIRQLIREVCGIKVCEEQKQNIEDTMLDLLKVCRQKELYCMHNDVDHLFESAFNSKLLSVNLKSQRLDKEKQEVKNIVEHLEDENDVYQEENDIDLEDILQIQDVILREKLLSSNCLIADIEFLNDNPTPDRTFNDHTEETRSGSTTAQANNSPPKYDSFCFKIEPDQGRLTSVVMNDISDNSKNDPLLEAVDLFLVSDNSMPSGIENIDYDSKGDIYFLTELLSNDFRPLPENESFNFDHHDDLSFPRPPPEPPDVEIFFEPD
uniref:Reverse transcriptase domain-containing protein n=1 Tax=Tanacetum cinerariifolium TaxID=118510 RepID=A0A699HJR6_TANCI|nr:hypothetical protein [Tanacetum cinerariifolium]